MGGSAVPVITDGTPLERSDLERSELVGIPAKNLKTLITELNLQEEF